MSTALISLDKYKKLAATLTYIGHLNLNSNCLEHECFRLFGLSGFKSTFEELEKKVNIFASNLMYANEAAYNFRYNESNHETLLLTGFQKGGGFKNKCELLKTMECIRYNCDDSLSKPTEKLLNEVIAMIQDCIIEELSEYQQADWF